MNKKTFGNIMWKKYLKRTGIAFSLILITSSVLVSCSTIKRPNVPSASSHYQINNVNVVDVITKSIHSNTTVEVKNGVIISVASHTNSLEKQSQNIEHIDGTGKYLIPGLWDNHSTVLSFSPEVDFPLYIANGVTSIRSNFSCANENEVSIYACMKDKSAWQTAIESEQLVGPNIHGWGTFAINGKNKQHPDLPKFHGANTPEKVNKVVEHYANYPENHQPHFLKTYNWIPHDSYLALTEYALENGFEIAGHLPRAVSIEEAVDAGQRSFAHARLFVYNCSKMVDRMRLLSGKNSVRKYTELELYPLLLENFDEQSCHEKYKYMADNNVYLNPTLMTRRNDYYGVAGMFEKMQGLDYAHYIMFSEWEEDIGKHGKNISEEQITLFKDFYELTASTVVQAHKAGVNILAGSDSWSEYNVPGFSLHEELQAMNDAGIDNFGVLEAATINGAKYFGIADTLGSINIGKQAEMILLNANPIDDIKNAQKIAMVFKGNQVFKQEKIAEMKADVKDIADSHMFTAKLVLRFLQNPTSF